MNADALSRLTNENDEDEITNIANENKTYIICLSSTLMISISSEIDDQQTKDENINWIKTQITLHKDIQPKFKSTDLNEQQQQLLKYYNKLCIRENKVYFQADNEDDEIIYTYVVPEVDQATIIEQLHSPTHCGHLGINKTYKKIKERFFWPKMQQQIEKFIRECNLCQKI